MNPDHLPFAAFALESAARERHGGRPHTLTLRLTRPSLLACSFGAPMSGRVELDAGGLHSEGRLRAAVLPVEGPWLTITF